MSITHTNRKGVTYYLCRGVAKSGKPRYYFARRCHSLNLFETFELF